MLILVGLRGSGKTTIGRALAARLGASFVDLDDLTVRGLGFGAGSVAQAWRAVGEAGFRAAEKMALAEALRTGSGVVALGGGTPMIPGALDMIRAAQAAGARVVYLRALAATLRARLEGNTADRPGLTGADPLAEIGAVLAARDAVYLGLADLVVNVDGKSEAQVLAEFEKAD